ncbi:hypothetical protein EPr2_0006 [Providencia phage EPr2]|uniref:Uncharacterized protein n=1 Tax=Providencia phage EPr2 TaxID=2917333 RepID=A0AC61TT49_9CAUD|nr:hypothetical protein EPr2_0006 [Providencia phage EPr2]
MINYRVFESTPEGPD